MPSPRCVALARATGARVAWVPRRAGERGAVEAGALPSLLPGGRGVADAAARAEVAALLGLPDAARRPGPRHHRHPHRRPRRAARRACWSAASTPPTCPTRRWPRPRWPRPASWSAWRCSRARSPSGPTSSSRSPRPPEKAGSYLDWEGRVRSFDATLHGTGQLPDGRVLQGLADEMDVDLRLPTPEAARAELAALGAARRPREGAGLDVAAGRPRRRSGDGRGACSPPGGSCSTSARCSATSPSSPAPPARRWPGSAPDAAARLGARRRRPADRQRGDRLGHPAGAGDRRCPTRWSGCR